LAQQTRRDRVPNKRLEDCVSSVNGHPGPTPRPPGNPDGGTASPRTPRRLVLLEKSEHSPVEAVLAEYRGAEVSGNRVHADLQQFAADHPGRQVAAEWQGPLGWTRFLWCRK
jgi:hypothetical protein